MNILGIHGGVTLGQHDAAAALIVDGSLVCCIEEERLTRVKSPRGILPVQSMRACLKEGNLSINDIDLIITPGETECSYHQNLMLELDSETVEMLNFIREIS